jgi:hypothetical protein
MGRIADSRPSPLVPTLLKLSVQTLVIMGPQMSVGVIESYVVGKPGTDAAVGQTGGSLHST